MSKLIYIIRIYLLKIIDRSDTSNKKEVLKNGDDKK